MFKRIHLLVCLLLVTSLMASMSTTVLAQRQKPTADIPKGAEDQAERARDAANVLSEINAIPEKGIPDWLMKKATGIAVIPHVVKGAFGIGGRFGKGLMSQRMANGQWSAPTYIEISGGSFGLQLGVEATDLVLVFTNDEGVKSLLKGKLKLGADASVAAGPVGRGAEAGTDVKLNSAVYSYSRAKGLFAGAALDGSVISIDDSANGKVYGKSATVQDILMAAKFRNNPAVAPFMNALQTYSPARTQE